MVLTVEEELHLVHGIEAAQRRRGSLHHQQLFVHAGAVERFLAHIHPGLAAGDVNVKAGALGDDGTQAHTCRVHVVLAGLDHQGEGRLSDAILFGDLPGHGDEVALAVLIKAYGTQCFLRRCGGLGGGLRHRQGRLLVKRFLAHVPAAPQGQHDHQRCRAHDQNSLPIRPLQCHLHRYRHSLSSFCVPLRPNLCA